MKLKLMHGLLAIVAVFAPIQGMIITCLVLILADLILGILAARKQKQPITSAGLRRTVTKLFVYELAIMLGYLTQHFLMADSIAIASIISGYIGITELISVLENLNIVSGNNLLKAILKKLGSANDEK